MAVFPYILDAYRDALSADEPLWALRDVAAQELERNHGDRERILADLEQLRVVLREEGRDDEDDTVLDVMSFLVGWCSPRLAL
jgi:hypothetical protein